MADDFDGPIPELTISIDENTGRLLDNFVEQSVGYLKARDEITPFLC